MEYTNGPFNLDMVVTSTDGARGWIYSGIIQIPVGPLQANINTNTPYLLTFYGSTTDNKRILELMDQSSGTPAQDTVTGGFYLPYSSTAQTSLFGEMIIIRGTMTESDETQS